MSQTVVEVERTYTDCCIIKVKLTHNGYQGGDAGHGGFVHLLIKDLSSTAMFVDGEPRAEFSFRVEGDAERDVLIRAMKDIIKELE